MKRSGKKESSTRSTRGVITFITQKSFGDRYKPVYYDKTYPSLHRDNAATFGKISRLYVEMRNLRNHLTHVNPSETKSNIKLSLNHYTEALRAIITSDMLGEIKK